MATGVPSAARVWAAGGALSVPATDTVRSGPADGLLLLAGGSAAANASTPLASAELYGFATIHTDKSDYAPGTTVTITGSGWQPNEWVTLLLKESPDLDEHPLLAVQADDTGNIISTEFSPDAHDVDIRFYLTAIGQYSQAQTTFTDGGQLSYSPLTASLTIASGSSGSFTQAVTAPKNNVAFTATVAVTPTPTLPAISASWISTSPSPLSFVATTNSDPDQTKSWSVTVAVPTGTAAGTYTANVFATPSAGPNDGNNKPTVLTVTVTAPIMRTLTVAATGAGVGTIASTPAGISCTSTGGTTSGTCSASFIDGSNVTLSATPSATLPASAGSTFNGWSGDGTGTTARSVTMSANSSVTASFKANQTINFAALGPKTFGDASFTVSATGGGSANAVTFASTTATVCTTGGTNGATVTIVAAGSCSIKASQAGNISYNAAPDVSQSFTINPATLTASIIGDPTKSYDGNATATLAAGNFSLSGLASGQSISVTKTSGLYNSVDVATATSVSTSLAAGDFNAGAGTTLSNYVLPTTASGPGHISAIGLTASITGNPTKPYDGTATATLVAANFSLSGLASGQSISVTKTSGLYNSADVATTTSVSTSLVAGDFIAGAGTALGNYVLPTTASGAGHITAVTLTASIIGNPTKPYDGTATATLATANFSLSGLIAGESISVTKTSALYNSPDVTTATSVSTSLVAGDFTAGTGTALANYVLPTTASGAGHITAVTLTASIIGNPTKPYDGTATATLAAANFSLSGLVTGESINVTKTSGLYNSADVATATSVSTSLLAGDFTAAASTTLTNYVLPTTASGAGHITAVTLTASIIGNPTKPYDGTATATLAAANFSLSGLASGQAISVTKTSGLYNSADVATASSVSTSFLAGDFTAGAGTTLTNYVLPTTASGVGHITAVTLTAAIIGNPTKPYDGTATATLGAGNFSLSGLASGQSISVTKTSGLYNSADVATATSVSTSLLGGDFTAGAGTTLSNYVLPTIASGPGRITAVTLTASIIGNPTKPYDGTGTATLGAGNFSLSGLVTGESISVTKTTGLYNSADVATATSVSTTLAASDFTAGAGTALANYVLPTTASGAGHITAVTLTASIIGNPTKPYDGTANATLAAGNFSLSGLVSGQSISVTKTTGLYDSADVATATSVSTTLAASDFTAGAGTALANYVLPTTASGAGHITAVTLTAAIIGNPTKPYDGTATATLSASNFSLSGLLSGQSISVTKTTGVYNSADVASATSVSTTLAAGDFTAGAGTALANYVLPTTASGAGHITAVTLTAAIIGNPTKPYDGTATATLSASNFSLSGLLSGQSISVTKTTGLYNSADVAAATSVSTTLAASDFTAGAGTALANYVLPTTASGAGHITAVTLTAAIIGNPTKPYDGTATATLSASNFSLSGLLSGQSISVTKTTGLYNSADVAAATSVSTTLAASDFTAGAGTALANYVLPTTASGPGHITAVTLTVTPDSAKTKTYGDTFTAFTGTVTGLINGNTGTATYASTGAVAGANVGSYDITSSFSFTLGSAANYDVHTNTAVNGLTVNKATPILTWSPNPLGPITYGTTLAGLLTASSGPVPGSFTYAAGATPVTNSTVLNVNTVPYTLTATFTPTDTTNYVSGGTVTNSLKVQYAFGGFLQPIANLPVVNAANGGQTIPVKWQLTDASGNLISDLSSFTSLLQGPVACDVAPASIVVDDPTATTGATVFRFDGTQFIYNWQTAKSWKGCFALVLNLKDGTQHVAKFTFK